MTVIKKNCPAININKVRNIKMIRIIVKNRTKTKIKMIRFKSIRNIQKNLNTKMKKDINISIKTMIKNKIKPRKKDNAEKKSNKKHKKDDD